MPTPTKGPRLGGSPAHQRLILSNMAGELFTHGRLKTTLTRAKRLRPFAEKLITTAKAGDPTLAAAFSLRSLHVRQRTRTLCTSC